MQAITYLNWLKKARNNGGLNREHDQILLLFDKLAQVGTFLISASRINGVAVTSQILCISITLNKRNILY